MNKRPPFISINNIVLLFFALSVFSITRQFPVKKFSSLILVFLILAFGVALPKIWSNFMKSKADLKIVTVIYFLIFTTMFLYSVIIRDNSIVNAMRTYSICILLAVSYFFNKDKRIVHAFILVVSLHALALIGIELYMALHSAPSFNSMVRGYFQRNGFGDIYSRNGFYFRIIIKGNELLPVAFMLADMVYKKGIKRIVKYIILMGVAISGNLASFISLSAYVFLRLMINKKGRKVLLGLTYIFMAFFLIFNKPIMGYVSKTMALKNESSMPIRYEQAAALIGDMREWYDVLMGKGMGSTITAKTEHREYKEDIYFELQILYFFNQLGVITFFTLIIYNLFLTFKVLLNKETLIIYGCYLLYALTNPYILNTTHIIVIICLISFKHIIEKQCDENEQQVKTIR